MKKILFLCHGNICRSPMAEYIMKDIVKKNHKEDEYEIYSKALTYEEIGNDIYYKAKEILDKYHIPYDKRQASIFTKYDYDYYDIIIIMDDENKYYLNRIVEDKNNKVFKLLSFLNKTRDVSDPWYTRDFEKAYDDILNGCNALYKELEG